VIAAIVLNFTAARFSYADKPLFSDLSWEIQAGEKIGLVGANGSGKSTLLRLILGELRLEDGSLFRLKDLRVGYLPQEVVGREGERVREAAMGGSPEIAEARKSLDDLEKRLADPAIFNNTGRLEGVLASHALLLQRYEELGGLTYENRVRSTLIELGFREEDFERFTKSLSGGEAKLVGLARLLVWRPDVLLLDEPDNHLDLAGKRRVEQLVAGYPGAVIIVSHDRYLLDQVVGRVAELAGGRITSWPGTYSQYAVNKQLAQLRQEQLYQAQQRRVSQIEAAIRRFEHWASIVDDARHARQARSRYKMLDRMERVGKPSEQARLRMDLGGWRGSNKVLELSDIVKRFPQPTGAPLEVLKGVQLCVWHGERVGLVGENGAGKTVLLRCVLAAAGLDELQPDSGTVKLGPSVQVGYYAQQHESLHPDWTPLQEIRDAKPMYEGEAVSFLGRFLFDYQSCSRKISNLSGGERSRLQLARLVLSDANFLLLDEPTNNLDIPSSEALEAALEQYSGTLLVISHDRYFLDRIADRVAALADGRIEEISGGYSDYLAQRNS
jgi:ATP-binding cassette subfamily F protein 3